MTDNDTILHEDAQPVREVTDDVAETYVFEDGTVLLGHDPFEPIDVSDVPTDEHGRPLDAVDRALE